jgi:carbonic anhydrase
MHRIINGVRRFQEDVFPAQRARFAELARGQRPAVLFVTCSDSRVHPNLLTQTDPGDLFILRNAGNIIPPYGVGTASESATVEYAVSVLNVADIVVCGHTHCGAMQALMNPEKVAQLPAVAEWLRCAETTRRVALNGNPPDDSAAALLALSERNVMVQLDNLRTHPAVAAGLAHGTVHVHGWVYDIEHGGVTCYSTDAGRFVDLWDMYAVGADGEFAVRARTDARSATVGIEPRPAASSRRRGERGRGQ